MTGQARDEEKEEVRNILNASPGCLVGAALAKTRVRLAV